MYDELKARMKEEILRVCSAYFHNKSIDDSVVTKPGEYVDPGIRDTWSQGRIACARLHDEDYAVFTHFRNEDAVILDIGAHFGYSAVSMWAAGSKANVVSFEPSSANQERLESLRTLMPSRYDYYMIGLGSSAGLLEYVVPVLNGAQLGALCTMDTNPNIDVMVDAVLQHHETYGPAAFLESFRLHRSYAQVERLDDFVSSGRSKIGLDNIVAMKIDVEGMEAEVLGGAQAVLDRHKPLILVEAGNSHTAVVETLKRSGYLYASRFGETLRVGANSSCTVNQFFCHRERLEEYLHSGMLVT